MLFRFSLYAFLKNQQYYEPFLILAFLQKGLSFFQIGLLIGFREVCINLMEVPSGAVADVAGRRRAMMLSFAAFIASFAVFGLSTTYWHLFPAMVLFAIGDAFRTGTHKAMVFQWIRDAGLWDDRTRVYGYTRSWGKIGSAVSVVIIAAVVFVTKDYAYIFWMCIPPYVIGLVNFGFYPARLDGRSDKPGSIGEMGRVFVTALRKVIRRPGLRGLVLESICFEGTFKSTKDYLQPLVKGVALTAPVLLALHHDQRTAIVIGAVFLVLYLLSSWASRQAYRVVNRFGSEASAARALWVGTVAAYGGLLVILAAAGSGLADRSGRVAWPLLAVAILLFMGLYVIQNFWRPALLARFNEHVDPAESATVLSIESQTKTWGTMVLAPLLGLAVDRLGSLWPVGAVGLVMAGLGLLAHRLAPKSSQRPVDPESTPK